MLGQDSKETQANRELRKRKIGDIEDEVRTIRKRLRNQPSLEEYGAHIQDIFLEKVAINDLKIKNSYEAFPGNFEQWRETEDGFC